MTTLQAKHFMLSILVRGFNDDDDDDLDVCGN